MLCHRRLMVCFILLNLEPYYYGSFGCSEMAALISMLKIVSICAFCIVSDWIYVNGIPGY